MVWELFTGTHLTEKVRYLIFIEQYMLFQLRYRVLSICGIGVEISVFFSLDLAEQHESDAAYREAHRLVGV